MVESPPTVCLAWPDACCWQTKTRNGMFACWDGRFSSVRIDLGTWRDGELFCSLQTRQLYLCSCARILFVSWRYKYQEMNALSVTGTTLLIVVYYIYSTVSTASARPSYNLNIAWRSLFLLVVLANLTSEWWRQYLYIWFGNTVQTKW